MKLLKSDKLVGQLKALKTSRTGGSPDERWLASTRETLLMQMRNTVGERPSAGFRGAVGALRLFVPEHWGRALAVPLAVALLMFGASFGSGAVITLAHGTLPGDILYNAKLAAERISLLAAGREERTERRLEIAGRRLDEMVRLAVSADDNKEDKIGKISAMFSGTMSLVRKDLSDLRAHGDATEAVRIALRVDAKADEYQHLFKAGTYASRPAFRLALLSLDQVSVDALEVLVEKQNASPDVLLAAQLTSNVGKRIETFAGHVAVTEGNLIADENAAPQSLLLAAKAKEAVEEAKELLEQGDFRAAVRKVGESASLVAEAEAGTKAPEQEPQPVQSVTNTPETTPDDAPASASGPAVTPEPSQP